MNFCVWSLQICRELKQLLTRMMKKQVQKSNSTQSFQFLRSNDTSTAHQMTVNDNIWFLSIFMNRNKIFWISYMLWIESQEIVLDKSKIQIDQKSDMNVIQQVYTEQLELEFYLLFEIDFQKLFMRCTDNRKTFLQYWIYLNIEMKRIWKCI